MITIEFSNSFQFADIMKPISIAVGINAKYIGILNIKLANHLPNDSVFY